MTARTRRVIRLASAALLVAAAGQVLGQGPAAPPKVAATVNGEQVSFTDLKALLDQQPPPPTPLSATQQRELQQTALEMLIDDLLMRQFLRKNGPAVDQAEVAKQLA